MGGGIWSWSWNLDGFPRPLPIELCLCVLHRYLRFLLLLLLVMRITIWKLGGGLLWCWGVDILWWCLGGAWLDVVINGSLQVVSVVR